jgi:DNA-binding transcriptional regulator WhiA
MDKQYLAGFFDADGYISALKEKKDEERKIVCGFTNTNEELLNKIRFFIEKKLQIKTKLHTKKSKKITHKVGFELRVNGPNALKLLNQIPFLHPKKVKRLSIAVEIQKCTPRNGKYTKPQLEYRRKLCDQLLSTV